jgi:LuxR family maltose regulon positive regulatory protein
MDAPSSMDFGAHRSASAVEWVGADVLAVTAPELRAQFGKIGRTDARKRLAGLAGRWPIAADMLVDWALRTSEWSPGITDSDILHESGLFEFVRTRIWARLGEGERAALNRAAMLAEPRRSLLKNAVGHDLLLTRLAIELDGLVRRTDDLIELNPILRLFAWEQSRLDDPRSQARTMSELADVCSMHGNLSDAARLASAAGQPDKIAHFAEQHGALLIWVDCGFSELQSLVENAGDDVIAGSPVLQMMRCIVDLKLGQISRAEAELHKLAADPTIADTMRTEVEIIRVTLLVYGCSLARQHDLEMLANLLAERSKEPAWQSFLATLSCILNSQRARFHTARASLREARREAERAGSRYNLMFLLLHEAAMQIAQGELTKARAGIAAARKMWREEFARDIGVETVISALSSKIEFETGRLTSARNSLRKSANRLPDGEAWFDIYFAAYEPMARLHMHAQGLTSAIEFLESEKAVLDARGLGRVGRLLEGLGHCLTGEARLSGHDVEQRHYDDIALNEQAWSWQERETYTIAAAYGHEGSGNADEAIALLQEARNAAAERSIAHSQVRYMLALFLIFHRHDRRGEALDILEELVALASETGMRQVAQDVVGPILPQYSEEVVARGALDEGQRKLLAEIGRERQDVRATNAALSKREIEVVTILAQGHSDKEIARILAISDHGVRYHLKNIFRKLGVHDRLSAVLSAKQRGWA